MTSFLHRTVVPVASSDTDGGTPKVTPGNKGLVLIVDDHQDTRDMLRIALESSGYEVIEAAEGNDALRMVQVRPPSVILLDLQLPDVDGTTVAQALRDAQFDHKFAIVFLSGDARPEARQRALDSGGDIYLLKPIGLDDLELVVSQSMKRLSSASAPIALANGANSTRTRSI